MEVVKRNGLKEPFNFTKVEKVLDYAINDESMMTEFIDDLQMNLKNNIATQEIQNILIKLASEKTTVDNPQWQFVSSKLLAYDLYKKAGISRGYKRFGYGSFKDLVKTLSKDSLYGEYLLQNYSMKDLDDLGSYIKSERDELFTYAGLKLFLDKYLVKGYNEEIYELPQERFMIVAMTLAVVEKQENRVEWAKEFYDVLSKFEVMTATPTLLNSGRSKTQLSSCFIMAIDDDLWSIYDINSNAAQLSKHSGGIGLYAGKIRSRSSRIQGRKGLSNGVIPWLKGYNNTALSVDQLGSRKGAIAVYLDVWHPDIFELLESKKNNGDERLKLHDLFPALCVPDLFMERVDERGKWHLIDPHEVYSKKGYRLEDYYGDEWTEKYNELVADDEVEKQEIDAILIMRKFLESTFETGTPFIFFRDTVNRDNPNKHAGMIYSSNLCTEIMQNLGITKFVEDKLKGNVLTTTKEVGDTVVCNLSSINLGKVKSEDDLARIIPIQVRMLDNVIDMNYYPIKEAEYTNKRYRAIGSGQMSYHEYLVNKGIRWESEEHLQEADKLYESIFYYTIKASCELAKERGTYPLFENSEWATGEYFEHKECKGDRWDSLKKDVMTFGIRNGYLLATAPTASISVISGTTATTDPIYNKFFIEEKSDGIVPIVAPNLSTENFFLYKESHTINQLWSIRAQGVRQKWIDQGNSFNLYITPDITAKELLNLYMESWKNGLKTVYYMRTRTLSVDDCVSCQ